MAPPTTAEPTSAPTTTAPPYRGAHNLRARNLGTDQQCALDQPTTNQHAGRSGGTILDPVRTPGDRMPSVL